MIGLDVQELSIALNSNVKILLLVGDHTQDKYGIGTSLFARSASILSLATSCTPLASKPSALPSITMRLTGAAHLISAPAAVADADKASIRPLTPPAGIAWAPLDSPAR